MTPAQRQVAPLVLALLRQGLSAAAPAQAEAEWREALALWPDHPDALQLLGLAAKRRGDATQAETLLRRSLQVQPAQPHVWNNLGNLLEDLGRAAEAQPCFAEACRQRGDYAEAHYNHARVLLALGRIDAAAQALQRAGAHLASAPALRPSMLHLRAMIEARRGDHGAALATLDAALALAPDRPALHHNRAVALHALGRATEALTAHDEALRAGVLGADAHYARGNTLQALGRLPEAAEAYGSALQADGRHVLALYDLARLRWRQGDPAFDEPLRRARADDPASAGPALVHGHLLWRAGRLAEAAEAFDEATRRQDSAEARDGLGRCLVRMGRAAEGLAHHERAVALAPADGARQANRAASLLVAGRADEAEAAARAALAIDAADQYALSLLGLAWRARGDAREQALLDVDRHVAVHDLPAPSPWATMPDFLEALEQELDALHHDRHAPIDQTLRAGTQTYGNILDQPRGPALQALRGLLATAIDDHLRSLPREPLHPFLGRIGRGWRYADSWSVRLTAGGHHVSHVHPHGWISAAFYVQVPSACADASAREGWLQFGVPGPELTGAPGLGGPPRREVQPRPGRLVLFPSALWHGTSPLRSAAVRTTVSFDVVPTSEEGSP